MSNNLNFISGQQNISIDICLFPLYMTDELIFPNQSLAQRRIPDSGELVRINSF
ncbi:hypothetical protein D1BOALGB6SA_9247 [Olavius sp. associated proteobacterium Delta 1]|nr:hypothetical protein D1BOALGB6SA_9247 [Olavius sp. associated proteobacterium Delta 1]